MAEVIKLADVKKGLTTTKQETHEHAGQRYTCRFDPNAPRGHEWVWWVDYVQTYRYVGSAATMEKASVEARRKIHALNKQSIDTEESI